MVVVRGMEVELYEKRKGAPVYVDHGVWRLGRYVRWAREERHRDLPLLDQVDELLRGHFPPGVGTVPRRTPRGAISPLGAFAGA